MVSAADGLLNSLWLGDIPEHITTQIETVFSKVCAAASSCAQTKQYTVLCLSSAHFKRSMLQFGTIKRLESPAQQPGLQRQAVIEYQHVSSGKSRMHGDKHMLTI